MRSGRWPRSGCSPGSRLRLSGGCSRAERGGAPRADPGTRGQGGAGGRVDREHQTFPPPRASVRGGLAAERTFLPPDAPDPGNIGQMIAKQAEDADRGVHGQAAEQRAARSAPRRYSIRVSTVPEGSPQARTEDLQPANPVNPAQAFPTVGSAPVSPVPTPPISCWSDAASPPRQRPVSPASASSKAGTTQSGSTPPGLPIPIRYEQDMQTELAKPSTVHEIGGNLMERFTVPCLSCLGPFAGGAFPPQHSMGPA